MTPLTYVTRGIDGGIEEIDWREVESAREILEGRIEAVSYSVTAAWEGLSTAGKEQALDRQEVVLEILTGYARGHAALAREGEPFWPFNPKDQHSLRFRLAQMSKRLEQGYSVDRARHRENENSPARSKRRLGPSSPNTLRNWCTAYTRSVNGGVFALIDGRRNRQQSLYESLEPEIRRIADEQVSRLDGSTSDLNIDELYRRTILALRSEGLTDLGVPEKTVRSYLSHLKKRAGRTTRSQRTNHLRGSSSLTSFPALRPGQVVAIDVTRADNLVWDQWSQKVISVEIITALDVASRVVLGVRVVPRSADSHTAGLILYDVLRPFVMAFAPDEVHDWRWAGVPESLGLLPDAVSEAESISRAGAPLIGEQAIPGVLPESIRADHGSIFTSAHFRNLCERFQINLLLSRGKKPTDNAFVERWHETLQRCLQQAHGHKGRNVSQRGSDVGKLRVINDKPVFLGDGPLLTARELELHLKEFITVDYHRSWHQGLTLVDRQVSAYDAELRMTPLDIFDAMLAATGRLHVLQRPDLIYDLLPIVWGTIGHAGVEFKNLTYDCRELDEFRNVTKGFFRDGDRAAPFFRDPHDVSRVWFRHPDSDRIIEVPWRKAHQLEAPMTDAMLAEASKRVRQRGGNRALNSGSAQKEILDQLNDVGDLERLRRNPEMSDWSESSLIAARMRTARSKFDHAEAQGLMDSTEPVKLFQDRTTSDDTSAGDDLSSYFDDVWPDYDESET
ncbi:MAG: hypothetical protein L0K67_01360 [Brevibacterium sp.]|nr:hypothetical protein [Brevibacterium sp.]